jgi:molybdopterin-containing oxidoreductase family iron-sulfur binding subunit
MMKPSRRRFLHLTGAAALGLGAVPPVFKAIASSQSTPGDDAAATTETGHDAPAQAGHGEGHGAEAATRKGAQALKAKQWAMVIDTRKLTHAEDLEPLIEACHRTHNVPHIPNQRHEIMWLWETHYHNAFPGKTNRFLNEAVEHRPFLVLCNHCENPPCVRACPTKATFKRESDGIVLMDFHRCIGCRFCMAACPFGARSFNFRDPRPFLTETNKKFPTRMMGVVEKCNFCAERLAEGLQPACVEASKGAIAFGDLYDSESHVRELLHENFTIRRKQGLGTEPAVYYIV